MLFIVTGASSNHFKTLLQFLESVKKYENKSKLIIFNLGLTTTENSFLLQAGYEVRLFDFDKYPQYFKIQYKAGEYAWKPEIVANIMNEKKDNILWMDAGCIITEPLIKIRNILNDMGLYSPKSSGTIKDWTHSETIKEMLVTKKIKLNKNRAGTVVGVNYKHHIGRDIIEKWRVCARQKKVIAPRGSSRKNHRQDQAILSVLINQAIEHGHLRNIPYNYLGFTIHNDL